VSPRPLPLLLVAALALSACDAPAIAPITADPAAPAAEPDQPARPGEARPAQPAPTAEDAEWNGDEIRWLDYDTGLARARAEGKPICLVLHAAWCPHCHTYARVFSDPRVVAESRRLVMVRVDVDRHSAVASRFALDGTYVPRTYFLRSDGTILDRIDAHRERYRYFFDESNPASILSGMAAALSPG
jgi:protein-disulfide reductase (glutathione)